jgi:REase_DpnII-MboI
MPAIRLSRSLCAVIGNVLSSTGSHDTLNALFEWAGAPGDPPALSHASKWKEWLFRAGQDPTVDSLAVLGSVLEEFMDLSPKPDTPEFDSWKDKREQIETVLANNGLRYYRFGRVLSQDEVMPQEPNFTIRSSPPQPVKPSKVEELLEIIIRGLRRAMHPLTHRRKGAQPLSFANEYDVQDLLHAMLRPWISDIRPEEYTPSYAGSNTRMDFLIPAYSLVIETKLVRDRTHAKKIGDELIIDIEHYRGHPDCMKLWCVVYDPENLITNAEGLRNDLEGAHSTKDGEVVVRLFVL